MPNNGMSLCDGPVKGLKNDGHQVVALGAFDLLEGLNVLVFGPVHDGKNFCDEMDFIPGPVTARTRVERLQERSLLCLSTSAGAFKTLFLKPGLLPEGKSR